MKEKLFQAVNTMIKDPLTRVFVCDFLNYKTPAYFWTIPASSTGKYHPKFALGEGGLVRHTIAAMKIGEELCRKDHITGIERDAIIAALALHDTFKQGKSHEGSGKTEHNHPELAASAIPLTAIATLVLTHMGQWGTYSPILSSQHLVHTADYIASRKFIEITEECE